MKIKVETLSLSVLESGVGETHRRHLSRPTDLSDSPAPGGRSFSSSTDSLVRI
jgi:hypothetical protein